MAQDRKVTLNYDGVKLTAVPNPVKANGQDAIVFQVGRGALPDQKLRITVQDQENFPVGGSERTGNDPLRVQVGNGFKKKTSYKCELFDGKGKLLASADGASGGEIEPDTVGGAQ